MSYYAKLTFKPLKLCNNVFINLYTAHLQGLLLHILVWFGILMPILMQSTALHQRECAGTHSQDPLQKTWHIPECILILESSLSWACTDDSVMGSLTGAHIEPIKVPHIIFFYNPSMFGLCFPMFWFGREGPLYYLCGYYLGPMSAYIWDWSCLPMSNPFLLNPYGPICVAVLGLWYAILTHIGNPPVFAHEGPT